MEVVSKDNVANLLMQHIPRDLLMGVEEALFAGALRGFKAAEGMHDGHKATVLGQMRHFHMNEAFAEALAVAGGNPTPIKGNAIVVGRVGVFALSRFNISGNIWNNGRRSRTRREMSEANRAVEPLVQPELFEPVQPITAATAFFVAGFSGNKLVSPDSPIGLDIAVPDSRMQSWLFRESLQKFIGRYDIAPIQVDTAFPKLKAGIIKLDGSE